MGINNRTQITVEGYKDFLDYKHIKNEIKILEEKLEPIKERIIKLIGNGELLVDDNKILATYKTQSRTKIDFDRLKIYHPDIYQRFLKTTYFKALDIVE